MVIPKLRKRPGLPSRYRASRRLRVRNAPAMSLDGGHWFNDRLQAGRKAPMGERWFAAEWAGLKWIWPLPLLATLGMAGCDWISSPCSEDDECRPAWLFPAENPSSQLVRVGEDGRLGYPVDSRGNVIPDFSTSGFRGGDVPIPDVAVKARVSPGTGDDAAAIQGAIDRVAKLPVAADGFRGAVLLERGVFRIDRTITIEMDGIVIRGEGAGRDGTIVFHQGKVQQDSFFVLGGILETALKTAITDPFVPVGATRVGVASTEGLRVGQPIVVFSKQTQKWVDTLVLPEWKPEEFALRWERRIVGINREDKTIRLNAPITSQIDTEGGFATGEIHVPVSDQRRRNIGFEDLMLISDYDRSKTDANGWYNDEDHGWHAIYFYNVQDAWVRRVVGFFYGLSMVWVHGDSGRVTVEDAAMLDGVSLDTPTNHQGTRKYSFSFNGSASFGQRLYARYGRHAFVMAGPGSGNVFLDSYSDKGHLAQEPHQRWQNGSLYDGVYSDSMFNLRYSSGWHGMTAANCALWNVVSNSQRYWDPEIALDAPPGELGQNWVIGADIARGQGKGIVTGNHPIAAKGHLESTNQAVSPRSLYLAQLRDRLGEDRVLAITTPTQRVSSEAVFAKLLETYGGIEEYGDPADLSWVPALIPFDAPGP